MRKIFHFQTHSMEQFYPVLINNITLYKNLDHNINRLINNLKKYDSHKKFEHILVTFSSQISNKIELRHRDGYKIIILPSYRLNYFFEFSFALKEFISHQISPEDIIHVHGISNLLFEQISYFLFKFKYKNTIVHYRGGHFTFTFLPMSFIKYFITLPFFMKKYSRVIFQSPYSLKRFKYLKKDQICIIPNCIDSNFSCKRKISKIKNILFVGRLVKQKGILQLVDVFKKHFLNEDLNLFIVGTGKLYKKLKEENKSIKNIYFFGQKNRSELHKIFCKSHLLVLPTHTDSFGNVILEGMAHSLPIISTFTDGPTFLLENTPNLLYKYNDKKQLFQCIKLFIKMPSEKLKQISVFNFNKSQKFYCKKVIKKFFELYNSF